MNTIASVIGVGVVVAALGTGCTGSSEKSSIDTGALEAVEASGTVVLDKSASNGATVFDDRIELFTSSLSAKTLASIKEGVILVGRRGKQAQNPHGFLRKVKDVSKRPGNVLLVTTSSASLGDAIQQGEVAKQTKPIDPYVPHDGDEDEEDEATAGGAAAAGSGSVRPRANDSENPATTTTTTPLRFEHTIDAKTIVSTSNFEARLEPTKTSCTPTFDTALRMRGFHLDTLRFVMDDHLTIETEVSATAHGRFERSVTIPLFRNKIPLPPQQIGPIPIVETVDVAVDLTCDFNAEGSLSARAGLRADMGYRFGVEYVQGDWRMIADPSEVTLTPIGPTVEGQASAKIDCRIVPRVALLFYDMVGPYISLTPRLVATANGNGNYAPTNLDAGAAQPTLTGQWALTGSLRAEAGLMGSLNIPGAPSLSSLANQGIQSAHIELFSAEKKWNGNL